MLRIAGQSIIEYQPPVINPAVSVSRSDRVTRSLVADVRRSVELVCSMREDAMPEIYKSSTEGGKEHKQLRRPLVLAVLFTFLMPGQLRSFWNILQSDTTNTSDLLWETGETTLILIVVILNWVEYIRLRKKRLDESNPPKGS
ncbi:MAG: hypothetical protein ABIK07_10295 [Planctomycetota bacterium]